MTATSFCHEDGTACQHRVCLRPHPMWETPALRETEARPESFPLTCEWCRNKPVTHLLIVDTVYEVPGRLVPDRQQSAICGDCAHRDFGRARELAKSASSAWLFRLTPDTGEG